MHIEMAALRTLGDWLEGSGWCSALSQSGVTTQGRAEAVLSVKNLDRARYTHQVGAAVLYSLSREAYEDSACDDPISYEEWCQQRQNTPQFRYWDIVLKMQLICLQIVHSMRNADFKLFIMALARFAPFFFALDHQNYARWLPVHIRDNQNLDKLHPSLWESFMAGHFVAQKTGRDFSGMPLDQAHEQLNAQLKGDGGFNGLTENPAALLKFMLTAPEVAEINVKFQRNILKTSYQEGGKHHLDNDRSRSTFVRDKMALEDFFRKSGNPFAEESLVVADTRKCCSKDVVQTVMKVEELGKAQYETYCSERLEKGSVSIHAPIKRNNLPTFAKAQKVKGQAEKTKLEIKNLKDNLDLMNRMWVASASNRPGNPKEFFAREISQFPPALAFSNGAMRVTVKADLLNECLAPLLSTHTEQAPSVDIKVFDGAVLMYLLKPSATCLFFSHFRDQVFFPYLQRESRCVSRIDIVWDVYLEKSLKNMARERRGVGIKTRVAQDTKIPKMWSEFLRDPENKRQLFEFLAEGIPKTGEVEWYSTLGTGVITSSSRNDLSGLTPCNHEEADTRIFVHVADAVREGWTKVMVYSCDTDVVVLACSAFEQLKGTLKELWIRHTSSKEHKFIPVHELNHTLGPQKSLALSSFHAYTGCDTVDAIYSIGKKTAWKTLALVPEAIEAFIELSEGNIEGTQNVLEKFFIAMYSPGKTYESVNDCRQKLLPSRKRHECIPPTQDALDQRTRRAAYTAQVWKQLLHPIQELPCPSNWGWKSEGKEWVQRWTTLPPNKVDNVSIVSCRCKVACVGNCKCSKENVECVAGLCTCICAS